MNSLTESSLTGWLLAMQSVHISSSELLTSLIIIGLSMLDDKIVSGNFEIYIGHQGALSTKLQGV